MKMLMIVARDSMVKELEELLHANGITAATAVAHGRPLAVMAPTGSSTGLMRLASPSS